MLERRPINRVSRCVYSAVCLSASLMCHVSPAHQRFKNQNMGTQILKNSRVSQNLHCLDRSNKKGNLLLKFFIYFWQQFPFCRNNLYQKQNHNKITNSFYKLIAQWTMFVLRNILQRYKQHGRVHIAALTFNFYSCCSWLRSSEFYC